MRKLVFALVFAPLAFVLHQGCANQGIGERCDPNAGNNGNDDCNGGLTCVAPGQLQWPANDSGMGAQPTQSGICCPSDPAARAMTTGVCAMSSPMFQPDSSIPVEAGEAGPTDAGDAGGDGATDAPSDAKGDAPSDAPAEGG